MSTVTEKSPASCTPATQSVRSVTPRVNIHQDEDGYTLTAEMPGVTKDGVEVTVENGQLKLVGRRPEAPALGRVIHCERPASEYRRTFQLDSSIDSSKVSAHIEQGLLTVRLTKSEALKPRRIAVS